MAGCWGLLTYLPLMVAGICGDMYINEVFGTFQQIEDQLRLLFGTLTGRSSHAYPPF